MPKWKTPPEKDWTKRTRTFFAIWPRKCDDGFTRCLCWLTKDSHFEGNWGGGDFITDSIRPRGVPRNA